MRKAKAVQSESAIGTAGSDEAAATAFTPTKPPASPVAETYSRQQQSLVLIPPSALPSRAYHYYRAIRRQHAAAKRHALQLLARRSLLVAEARPLPKARQCLL